MKSSLLIIPFTIFLLLDITVISDMNQAIRAAELKDLREAHLENLRQLTFGGENAEAYFSYDGKKLIFQSTRDGRKCDQIYTMDIDGRNVKMVSTGRGVTTCSYYLQKEGNMIIYSSTHHVMTDCPPKPDYSQGYVWPLHPYDIFIADEDGSNLKQLTDNPGYDAEATVSADGKRTVFTSVRDGDLEIYTMDTDGKNLKRLTHEKGYDGGAFFSLDGKKIVYRAYHPKEKKEIEDYENLLKKNLVRPNRMEIFIMDADGNNKKQITDFGAASFAPYFHPHGKRIIFASNLYDTNGRNFELYMINIDGTGLERITYSPPFNSFPMFSHDGKKLVFASNRGGKVKGETNIFIADWKE
jgi:Tol biopolymer transport system component